jgi:hypothetical protein
MQTSYHWSIPFPAVPVQTFFRVPRDNVLRRPGAETAGLECISERILRASSSEFVFRDASKSRVVSTSGFGSSSITSFASNLLLPSGRYLASFVAQSDRGSDCCRHGFKPTGRAKNFWCSAGIGLAAARPAPISSRWNLGYTSSSNFGYAGVSIGRKGDRD